MHEDKRKHPRTRCEIESTYKNLDIVAAPAPLETLVQDISEGGMRVRLDVDIGENLEVRNWTGARGVDNREFTMVNLVGEEFTLSVDYMKVRLGTITAKLIRVIRATNNVFFAMKFTEVESAVPKKIMTIIKRRTGG